MIQVLGDESEPTSKNNPVQTTLVPIPLWQALSIMIDLLVIISDEALNKTKSIFSHHPSFILWE